LRAAFPSSIATDVDAALRVVPTAKAAPSDVDIGPVRLAGEELHIPSRIYFPVPSAKDVDELSETSRTVLSCIYTRHHDGHVREKHVRAILASPLDWVPPFVVQLVGEYVIEIQYVIESNVACMQQQSYVRFLAENPSFIELTRQRTISYWNCYFRMTWRAKPDHVGFRILEALGVAPLARQPRVAADS
jgi:hypothetical protein